MSEAREKVRELVRRFVSESRGHPVSALVDDHDLFVSGDLDSGGFVELLTFLADETGHDVDFTEIDPGGLGVVGALIDEFTRGGSL